MVRIASSEVTGIWKSEDEIFREERGFEPEFERWILVRKVEGRGTHYRLGRSMGKFLAIT